MVRPVNGGRSINFLSPIHKKQTVQLCCWKKCQCIRHWHFFGQSIHLHGMLNIQLQGSFGSRIVFHVTFYLINFSGFSSLFTKYGNWKHLWCFTSKAKYIIYLACSSVTQIILRVFSLSNLPNTFKTCSVIHVTERWCSWQRPLACLSCCPPFVSG